MSPRTGGATSAKEETTAATTGHEPNRVQSIAQDAGPEPARQERGPQDSAIEAHRNESEAGEQVGLFQSHAWLVPVTVVVAIIAAFGFMFLLNWVAGGGAPFTR